MQAHGGNEFRDLLARRALREIPRLLTLQDAASFSPTYGCFDRNWWHYHVTDFPSGMAQKLVFPLALVWSLDLPGNPYRGQEEIRRRIEAGLRFAARSSHGDGSCDDYYPFERASGAAAFSLLACLDAAALIGVDRDPELSAFFARRGRWLATHRESGRLANHEALIACCLQRMVEREGDEWEGLLQQRLQRLLSWQDEEGWFVEYEGADPGYQTLTIAQLADLDRRRPELDLRGPCERAIAFIHALLQPDGTVGGEYMGRGTLNYFPHGMEIAGKWCSLALAINDRALQALAGERDAAISDDRLFGHHLTSWLLAWKEWQPERPGPAALAEGRRHFEHAGLLIEERKGRRLYAALLRGGAFRFYEDERLILADTGPMLAMADGRVAITHREAKNAITLTAESVTIAGEMSWTSVSRLTVFRSIVLRSLMLSVGRRVPDLMRRLLQRLLVTGRKPAPFDFVRTMRWREDGTIDVHDEIVAHQGWARVSSAAIEGFQSAMKTAMGRVWHAAQLQMRVDLGERLHELRPNDRLVVDRHVEGDQL